MFSLTADIQPLSYFKRNTAKVLKHLKARGNPMVLTINGKAELVVMDAKAYEQQIERDLYVSPEDLQAALDDVDAGRVRPMREVMAELSAKYGLSD